jgi:hypothetical protein
MCNCENESRYKGPSLIEREGVVWPVKLFIYKAEGIEKVKNFPTDDTCKLCGEKKAG